jgi:hypothetical protein
MKEWVMIAADALGEDEDLRNYIDMAMLFTCTLPPKKNRKTDIKNRKTDNKKMRLNAD